MKKTIILLGIVSFALTSCMEDAKIQVINEVHNVKMTEISWGGYSISSSLMPGEASEKITISEAVQDYPKRHRLKFYLNADGNSVFLETKEYFELDKNDFIRIIVTDTTEVVNPLID